MPQPDTPVCPSWTCPECGKVGTPRPLPSDTRLTFLLEVVALAHRMESPKCMAEAVKVEFGACVARAEGRS